MMSSGGPGSGVAPVDVAPRVQPTGTWTNGREHFLEAARSDWYSLVVDLQDVFTRATVSFWQGMGMRAVHMPLTTRTVTCPTGLGSDTEPVPVNVDGVETFLSDSMQFFLEYGCRIAPEGCYCIYPSFRSERVDETHLRQFVHSEAEFPGDLDELIRRVEGYLAHVTAAVLTECGPRLARAVGDVGHLERLASRDTRIERLRFSEAARLVGESGVERTAGNGRLLTRQAERRLLDLVGEFVWVTHFDHVSVPFYQGFGDDLGATATNADLFFGVGEVVGSGARHATADDLRAGLRMHDVAEDEYAWYVRLKEELPLQTAGFGMGVERYLLWVLGHSDIRDIPVIPRFSGPSAFPARVDEP